MINTRGNGVGGLLHIFEILRLAYVNERSVVRGKAGAPQNGRQCRIDINSIKRSGNFSLHLRAGQNIQTALFAKQFETSRRSGS